MCKQKSFRSKWKSNKRGSYSLLVLLFLTSKSTGTKLATFARSAEQHLCTIIFLQYE